jgi:hypothetical protein
LIPEIQKDEKVESHQDLIKRFSRVLNGEYICTSKINCVMTLELLLILCLPLMGFSGDPLSYEEHFDIERAFHR